MKIVFNNQEYDLQEGIVGIELLKALNLDSKDIIGISIDGIIYDLQTPIYHGGTLKPITKQDKESLDILRHSLAHIMAQALKEIYGDEKVHLGIGPTTEDGFFYDVEVEGHHIGEEDLKIIEDKMREIIKRSLDIKRKELSREEALKFFENKKEVYKLDIINSLPNDARISVYEQGEFVDLCRGPHIPNTALAGAFKLSSIAGAYWRGDASKPMLQRIYGIAFWTEKELEERLKLYEEAKKRDHRRLGKELELFTIDEQVGPGLIIWLPKGAILRQVVEDYLKEKHRALNYQFVYTPHVGKSTLWETSGHLSYYKENMFPEMKIEEESYYVKPMNCPFHMAIYKSKIRSHKELPIKIAELGTVYRYEMSGVLHGLMRVRGFTQDDAHIFCKEEDVKSVIKETLELAFDVLKDFGFSDYQIFISTKPKDAIGTEENWRISEEALKEALEALDKNYEIDEGGGAFYGPKIDIKIKDAIGRFWQCSTIQFDFNLPERFDLTYVGEDNKKHRPYIIHRALLGSIERFTGVLIEHYAGHLPIWLSPIQAAIIPIADRHLDYAKEVFELLKARNIRAYIDDRPERMNAKIRDNELQKIPILLVVGDKEVQEKSLSVRSKNEEFQGVMNVYDFIEKLKTAIQNKR
ncbi:MULTISPECIES: threonine--tRNA ligase [unclassified Hydrogenobaculum]|uniref:threonine--tRNA ligase n=1 Tax=unclassified Hydrogenobaculum TaxID=2622382 RepID=UPI0001C50D73|nr:MULTISPECIES: threonine--tRNA ligase [unclassified Hydrogenobaculum]AEF18903.1 threonyl-tRNA synthetase [Hydrogenobaculum sp. 3684]AEG46191.1 threonyl-tRNA synthetase [Hydrogenobaculum sp. SHO]AGG14836.1 Ser-tRNA(Thr) hydrolase [Hydrogenobaculum sp. HO]AGH93131.1 Ser-tRNA(Thr) hydrolase; threonyl-tRNA synthetase [Hydrogenobaculum sp. SN]